MKWNRTACCNTFERNEVLIFRLPYVDLRCWWCAFPRFLSPQASSALAMVMCFPALCIASCLALAGRLHWFPMLCVISRASLFIGPEFLAHISFPFYEYFSLFSLFISSRVVPKFFFWVVIRLQCHFCSFYYHRLTPVSTQKLSESFCFPWDGLLM